MTRYTLILLAACGVASAAAPKGLSDADWSSIVKKHFRHRQAVVAVEGGWRARNLYQNWSAGFDGRGFEVTPREGSWRWGLKLAAYGYAGQERRVGVPKPSADGEKFSYQWDSILREWYINEDGLEHGYTLASRPGRGTGLRFRLEILGTLEPQVSPDGRSISFVERQGQRPVLRYGGLKVNDATGRELPARFQIEAHELRLEIDDGDARYPLTVDPVAQQLLSSPTFNYSGLFGSAIAIDGNRIVVGDSFEDNPTDSGAAYVFHRTPPGTEWILEQVLRASNPEANDFFGWSVAISGDTIVVGAYGEDGVNNSLNDSGAAYVFQRSDPTGWSEVAYLKASNAAAGDYFGYQVAMSGSNVVVGAFRKTINSSITEAGAAYIFEGPGWGQKAVLISPNPNFSSRFSWSVAASGNTVVIGSYQAFFSGIVGGQAYVFTRGTTGWSLEGTLQAPIPDNFDNFGISVSVSGDTIVVGAYGESSNGNPADNSVRQSGAAYVFDRFGTQWFFTQYLKAWPPTIDALFGTSVAVSGNNLVVGSQLAGTLDVFTRIGGTGGVWTRRAALTGSDLPFLNNASQLQAGSIGQPVAISGDNVVTGPGQAHVFQVPTSQTVSVTIDTSPQFLRFTTSGIGCAPNTYNAPQTLVWTAGAECIIDAEAQAGLRFTHWEDGSTDFHRKATAPYSPRSYKASFGAQYNISVGPAGAGTVSGPNFTCQSAQCRFFMDAEPAGPLTFTVAPIGPYTFTGWSGDCSGTGACTFPSATGNKTITANFTPLSTSLSASLGSNKTGPSNARVWPVTFTNGGPGTASDIGIIAFSVLPTIGASCAVVTRPDVPLGTFIAGAGSLTFNATINFSGCLANTRFKVSMIYSYFVGTIFKSQTLNAIGVFP